MLEGDESPYISLTYTHKHKHTPQLLIAHTSKR